MHKNKPRRANCAPNPEAKHVRVITDKTRTGQINLEDFRTVGAWSFPELSSTFVQDAAPVLDQNAESKGVAATVEDAAVLLRQQETGAKAMRDALDENRVSAN